MPKQRNSSIGQILMRFAAWGVLGIALLTCSEAGLAQDPVQRSWEILEKGHKSHSTKDRANAVRALGLLVGNFRAARMALEALTDKKPDVRAGAALALGQIGANESIPQLKEALKDREIRVVFAASTALLVLGDSSGYAVYYEVLMGERKGTEGLFGEQKRLIMDPKQVSLLGLGIGMGFAPYAGYGWMIWQAASKDYSSPVQVESAKKLATCSDPHAMRALVKAASSRSWTVRVAAIDSMGRHDDADLLKVILPYLSDKKTAVRLIAAAAVIRLSERQKLAEQQSSPLP